MKRLLLLFALGGTFGCNHVTTRVPGILDMRTEGGDAPTAPAKVTSRSGFDSILWGDGVKSAGSQVSIEDRKYWIIRLINIANESATEEINEALGPKGVARKVSVGDTYTLMDFAVGLCGSIIPLAGFALPPFTATFEGTLIQAGGGSPIGEPAPPTGGDL
jgi:hypothetical protein